MDEMRFIKKSGCRRLLAGWFAGSLTLPTCHVALFAVLGLATVLFPAIGLAAERAVVFEQWRLHDESSAMKVDHRNWEAFLLNYLRPGADGIHRLAYGRVKKRDYNSLSRYIQKLSKVEVSAYARSEQLAYWINLYNALTVKLVLDHYPFASIQKLGKPGDETRSSVWGRGLVTIAGVSLSLDDIEKRILQPIWDDPRVHYAITCPAVGCPNLQPVPFVGAQLERQLSDAAMAFVNDPRCIHIRGDQLHVSSFYRWHLEEFGGTERAVINHLMAYAEPELAMALQRFDRLHGDIFDWRLNDITE